MVGDAQTRNRKSNAKMAYQGDRELFALMRYVDIRHNMTPNLKMETMDQRSAAQQST